jgi:hypothetical protein
MSFHVGQKVVCINDQPGCGGDIAPIRKGKVYTVVAVTDGVAHDGPDTGLVLAEDPPLPKFFKGYSARRFRPVVERKTNIEIFKAMLNPRKHPVEA